MTHRPDAEPSKKPAGRLSPSVVLNAVRHYPLAFAGLLALTAAVAAGVWLFMPLPKHTAAVVYHIPGQAPRVIATTETQVDANSYRQLQASMVKRRMVLNAALNQLKKTGDAPDLLQQPEQVAWLDKNLQVESRFGSEFMRVYLEGDNPDEMLAVVKAVAAAYQAAVDEREKGLTKKRLQDIDDSHKKLLDEIAANNKRIDGIADTLGSASEASLMAYDILINDELRAARNTLLEAESKLELARGYLPQPGAPPPAAPAQALVDEAIGKDAAVLAAEFKVQQAKDALAKIQEKVNEGSTALAKPRADVKAAEAERDKARADAKGRVEAAVKEHVAGTAAQKEEVYEQAKKQQVVAQKRVQEVVADINKRGVYRRDLEKLREEIGGQKKTIDELEHERLRIRVEERAASRVTVAEEPFTTPGIEGFRRLRMTLVAAGGLFVVGFAGLVWWEHRSRRVNRSDDVAHCLGLPLLGTLPPWAADQPGGHGELVEAIDSTRTVLLHGHTADRPLRTLVVTSALPGEGKTSLSGHLAVSLARAGYRTLLVDGDVREPSAHKVFDLPPGPGLCEVLRDEADAHEVTRETKVPNLSVMLAGKWSLTVRQALVGDRWTTVRRQLERQFDFVVLDTAPLLLTTDSLLLARGADGVVLSVLKGVSRIGSVAHTQERLSSLGARVLGVVVSGARPEYPGAYPYGRYAADRADGDPDAVLLTPA